MPEVVEVCLTAMYLDYTLKGKSILKLHPISGRYVTHDLKGLHLLKYPCHVVEVNSKGKFLWFVVTNSDNTTSYIMNTFGLDGKWGTVKHKHSDVELLYNDKKLYFTDKIKYGTIEITNNIDVLNNKLNSLGPDLLKISFSNDDFYKRIHDYLHKKDKINKNRQNKEIVKVLMDQSTQLGSGIGNYLVAEILYDAKISPHTKMIDLYNNKVLVSRLAHSIKYIIKLSFMNADIGYLEDMDSSLTKFMKKIRINPITPNLYHPDIDVGNTKFKFNVYQQKKDPLGNKILRDKIITGRTTYWSPKIQK